jgi:hypothetical protein
LITQQKCDYSRGAWFGRTAASSSYAYVDHFAQRWGFNIHWLWSCSSLSCEFAFLPNLPFILTETTIYAGWNWWGIVADSRAVEPSSPLHSFQRVGSCGMWLVTAAPLGISLIVGNMLILEDDNDFFLWLQAALDSNNPNGLFAGMNIPPMEYGKIITMIYLKVSVWISAFLMNSSLNVFVTGVTFRLSHALFRPYTGAHK